MERFAYENQGSETILVYHLEKGEHLDSFAKGMLQSNDMAGIIKPAFTQRDLDQYLKYNITSKITLKEYFQAGARKEKLLNVFSSVVEAAKEAEEYMLSQERFIFDWEWVYVDITRKKAYLLYLPIDEYSDKKDLKEFLLQLISSLTYDLEEDVTYVVKIINGLNKTKALDLTAVLHLLKQVGEEETAVKKEPRNTEPVIRPVENITPQDPPIVPPMPEPVIVPEKKKGWFSKKKKENKEITVDIPVPNVPDKKSKEPEITLDIDPETGRLTPPEPEKKKGLFSKKKRKEKISPKENVMPGPGPMIPPDNEPPKDFSKSVCHQPREGGTIYMGKGSSDDENKTVILGGGKESNPTVLLRNKQDGPLNTNEQNVARLIRKKNGQSVTIDKEVFRIGKESSFVDFYIGDNPAIGAAHADIFFENGKYYIYDRNSLNHTYVNGVMVKAGEGKELSSGDKITLADEEFEFSAY